MMLPPFFICFSGRGPHIAPQKLKVSSLRDYNRPSRVRERGVMTTLDEFAKSGFGMGKRRHSSVG